MEGQEVGPRASSEVLHACTAPLGGVVPGPVPLPREGHFLLSRWHWASILGKDLILCSVL